MAYPLHMGANVDRNLAEQPENHTQYSNGLPLQDLQTFEDGVNGLAIRYASYGSHVINQFSKQPVDTLNKLVDDCHHSIFLAVRYINEHYMDDLSLSLVAQEVYLSPSYFATLFKKTMGISFVDYLTLVRITQAKWLLQQHGLKIYQISEHVGYKTSRYFVHVFKQHVGVAPSEYREMCWNMKNTPQHYHATV